MLSLVCQKILFGSCIIPTFPAKPWTIPCPYTPDPAAGLVSAVPAKAGSG
jgi:hypothetical protein